MEREEGKKVIKKVSVLVCRLRYDRWYCNDMGAVLMPFSSTRKVEKVIS